VQKQPIAVAGQKNSVRIVAGNKRIASEENLMPNLEALGTAIKLEALHTLTRALFNRENRSFKRAWKAEPEDMLRHLWMQWFELRCDQVWRQI